MNISDLSSLTPAPADRLFGAAPCAVVQPQIREAVEREAMLRPACVARDAAPSYCAWPAELLPD